MINHQAFSFQEDMQTGTPESFPLLRQLSQAVTQDIVITRLLMVPVNGR
jgi:hypothetical protein